ncbi:UNVERIFIED_ORG: outer membrane receptor for ferric coprogen and ferric-rhodotorulic acid [Zoogloea ramigera]|uniref:TonB-dependent siderophore receptor n=1 Tax=Duganella zoogloeoides TaxID=75659 RepID=A0ABZ0XXM7_9BURK|nr:TonB-dependent siderophore receptor [Duganella zoogloeoides]WQH04500.1 TonB-dependent siderophore receptor [Duganella zoogloeoides]
MQAALRPASFRPTALHLAVLMVVTAAAQPALAQSADKTADPVQLNQVTVKSDTLGSMTDGSGSYTTGAMRTATRMDMSIRDTPQSVSVVTREMIDDLGAVRLDEVLTQTPGVTVGQQDSERTSFYARGFSITNIQVDGMAMGGNAPLQDTILYDRVEVVRGASGLMGGTGDPSATINLVRKRPGRALQASARAVFGRWDDRRAEIDVSAPLSADGSVRGRTAMAYQDRDSYYDMYHERKTVGMAIVEADLGASTLLTAGLTFQHNNPTGATWGAVPYWNADGSLARLRRNFSLSTPWSTWRNREHSAFTSLEHRFDNGWKVHLGYTRTDSRNNTTVAYGGAGYPDPATGTGMRLWTGVWGEGKNIDDNLDLYATGPFSLLGRRHVLIAGWNGSRSVSHSQGGEATIAYQPQIPDYRTWTGNIPMPTFTPDGSHTETEVRQGGAYLAGRFSVADTLTLVLGGRLSNYRTEEGAWDTSGRLIGYDNLRKTKNEFTPYVGAVLDLTDDISAYASYTSLFSPQSARDRNNALLDPETGTNSELGVKGEFFDKRLNASAAVFRTLKKNLAVLDPTVPPGFKLPNGNSAYVANGDGITARGIEFEVAGQVNRSWNVSAGYTFLRVKDVDGERAEPNQPRHLLRLSTAYRLDDVLKGLKVGGGVTAQSGTYGVTWYGQPGTGDRNARISQGGYALINAMASYEINRQLGVQLNVSNLADRKYYRNVGFYDSVFWGEPRNVRLALTARF